MNNTFFHFFGLRENPFNVNPDPRYLFLTRQTQEALHELSYGIQTRKGFILLTGEVGTGKTILINQLLDWLRRLRTPTAFVFNSQLDKGQLFDFMLADFGIRLDPRHNGNPLMCLNQWLIDHYAAGEGPVLIVDEAQGLSSDVLEEIRLLLNLETPREKLLQIVLAGQPELEDKLTRPELRQLRQRITLRCRIAPLTREETRAYIEQRLRIAGGNSKTIFVAEAMDAVHFYARGIPRVINLVCEHALINAYADQVQPVPVHLVEAVTRELQLDEVRPFHLTAASGAASANQATIQSIFESARIQRPAAHESDPRGRSHAPMAGISAYLPDFKPALSSNQPPVPAIPHREEIPAVTSRSESPAFMNAPVQPTAAFTPRQRRKYWPLKWPASAPAGTARHASEVVRTPAPIASSPVVPAPEANTQSEVVSATARNQISALDEDALRPHGVRAEEFTRRLTPTPIPRLRQSLYAWWPKWRDKCVSVVSPAAWRPRTASLLRRLQESLRRVQRHWRAYRDRARHSPGGVPIRPPHQSFFWRSPVRRNSYLSAFAPATWQQTTASLLRWLRQPLAQSQRRKPDQDVYKARSAQS
ncbi:MAG: AAA family ATPase [Candidatus Acidiferrales bacterium]